MQFIQLSSISVITNITRLLFKDLFSEYLLKAKKDPKSRKKLLNILWAVSIILMLFLSAGLIFGLNAATGSYKVGIFLSVIAWAIFFGVTSLLYLQSKIILTIFGFMLGSSASEIGSSAGLLTKANEMIVDISSQIGKILSGVQGKTDPFITILVWTFVIIVTLFCLPAFFEKEEEGH